MQVRLLLITLVILRISYSNNEALMSKNLHHSHLRPLDSRRAILEGWRLQFNLRAAPLFEPAMANITPIRGKPWKTDFGSVHGMAYLLTREDWMKVFRTEGGGRRGGYVPTYVQVGNNNNVMLFLLLTYFLFLSLNLMREKY